MSINQFLDLTAKISPGILLSKPKFHILAHLPEHILRFGPALLFNTERYESYNHIFRLCSVHSNHQAPSMDIAHAFARFSRVHHIFAGGFWFDAESGRWVQGSAALREYIRRSQHSRALLHLSDSDTCNPLKSVRNGIQYEVLTHSDRRKHINKPVTLKFADSLSKQAIALGPVAFVGTLHHGYGDLESPSANSSHINVIAGGNLPADTDDVVKVKSFLAKNGDSIQLRNIVLYRDSQSGNGEQNLKFAMVEEIISPHHGSPSSTLHVTVIKLVLIPECHPKYHLPRLRADTTIAGINEVPQRLRLTAEQCLCVINSQHDCAKWTCTTDGTQFRIRERETTAETIKTIRHRGSPTDLLVNTYTFHNNSLLRQALPSYLMTKPDISPEERTALRKMAALNLRTQKQSKKTAKESAAVRTLQLASRNLSGSGSGQRAVIEGGPAPAMEVDVANTPAITQGLPGQPMVDIPPPIHPCISSTPPTDNARSQGTGISGNGSSTLLAGNGSVNIRGPRQKRART